MMAEKKHKHIGKNYEKHKHIENQMRTRTPEAKSQSPKDGSWKPKAKSQTARQKPKPEPNKYPQKYQKNTPPYPLVLGNLLGMTKTHPFSNGLVQWRFMPCQLLQIWPPWQEDQEQNPFSGGFVGTLLSASNRSTSGDSWRLLVYPPSSRSFLLIARG